MKKILTLVLAFSLLFAFGCKKNQKNNTGVQNQVDTTTYPGYEEFTVDNNTQNTDTLVTNVAENDTVNTNNQKDSLENVMVEDQNGNPVPANQNDLNDKTKNFYVIVGSFKNDANAQKRVAYFKQQGYAAEILPKFGAYNRVAVAGFNEEASARAELKTLKSKYKDKSYWLLLR